MNLNLYEQFAMKKISDYDYEFIIIFLKELIYF